MECTYLRDKEGHVTAIVCGRRQPRRFCKSCNREFASKLCDFPVAPGKTCDAPICDKCATAVGPDLDHCPKHKNEKLAAEQGSLFAEVR
jgi:hypothetical protein